MALDKTWKRSTSIALLGLMLLSFCVNFAKNFELSDDNLYLYHSISTVVLKDAKSIEKQSYILSDSIKIDTIDAEEFSERWRMRAEYASNYVIPIYFYSLGSKISKFIGYESEFNTNFVSVILISFVFPFLVFALLLTASFKWMNGKALLMSVTLTFVVLYFTN